MSKSRELLVIWVSGGELELDKVETANKYGKVVIGHSIRF